MNRRTFLGVTMAVLESLYADNRSNKAPALFCAHGSPMNMLMDNDYTRAMKQMASKLKKPKAALIVSAHWVTNGLFISTAAKQETIHDFYGFPKALYDISYPAAGAPVVAQKLIESLQDFGARADERRGLDHGGWGVMKFLFPKADVPTFQMSLDKNLTTAGHFRLGERLSALRDEGVMIIGSGDIVHNLYAMERAPNAKTAEWALEFEAKIKEGVIKKDFETLIEYLQIGEAARLSCPTSEHYLPLLYVAAASQKEKLSFFYEGFEHGSISLSCFGTQI